MVGPLNKTSIPHDKLIGASAPERSGIVHLGLGNFHRAHAAVYTAKAMAAAGGDWGIRGFAHASDRVATAMRAQDGMYTVLEQGAAGTTPGIVDVHRGLGVATRDPQAVVSAIANPLHKVVTLTVSEKGYTRDPLTGGLDTADPTVQRDMTTDGPPMSTVGQLAYGIARRAATGEPLSVLSCDNLQGAGNVTRRLVGDFLHQTSHNNDVLDFFNHHVAFPNAMVDRIVPKTTEQHIREVERLIGLHDQVPIPAEPFSMWVIEDDFPAGRPDWAAAGAIFSDQVEAYEMLKLRLLNGSHSFIAYLGLLSGFATIDRAWNSSLIRETVLHGMDLDYLKTFTPPAGVDVHDYITSLSERWANPQMHHSTVQVGSDGSQKLVQRLAPAAIEILGAGGRPDHLALCAAAWLACISAIPGFHAGDLAAGLADPAKSSLAELSVKYPTEEFVRRAIGTYFPPELAQYSQFAERVGELLGIIISHGVDDAMRAIEN